MLSILSCVDKACNVQVLGLKHNRLHCCTVQWPSLGLCHNGRSVTLPLSLRETLVLRCVKRLHNNYTLIIYNVVVPLSLRNTLALRFLK